MDLAVCSGCQYAYKESELVPMLSVLDWRPHLLCWNCFDNHSEPIFVVVRTAGLARWDDVPIEIQQSVMVFDSLKREYCDFETWCRRCHERQLVPGLKRATPKATPRHIRQLPPPTPEDEALLATVQEKVKEVTSTPPSGKPRAFWRLQPLPEEQGWWRRFFAWIRQNI